MRKVVLLVVDHGRALRRRPIEFEKTVLEARGRGHGRLVGGARVEGDVRVATAEEARALALLLADHLAAREAVVQQRVPPGVARACVPPGA